MTIDQQTVKLASRDVMGVTVNGGIPVVGDVQYTKAMLNRLEK